jgi:ABC-type Fe3+ transport system substrate-binding protein
MRHVYAKAKRSHIRASDALARPTINNPVGSMNSHSIRATLLALSLFFAGSAAFAADVYQPDPKLVEAAKKEGQVLLYTTHIVDQIVRPLIKGFQTYVPGVDVKYVRGDGLSLTVRLTNEARANRVQSDIWCLVDSVGQVLQNGFAEEFEVPSAKELPQALVDPKHRWIATNIGVRSAAYNTQLVPKEFAPRSYQNLLDPRWKGKIVWNPKSMTGAWGFIATVIKSMGENEGMSYLRKLAKQDVVPLPIAIRAVLDRVIAGEYAIGLEMNNTHAAISEAQGAPVKWVPLDPVSQTLQVAGVTKGAPHPNAAKLFLDFMVSRTGQEIFRDNDYLPMHPDINAKIPELRPEQGGYRAVVYSPDEIDTESVRWAKIYEELFR